MSDAIEAATTGPDFAFPMDDAPKDGSILRLLVRFDPKSSAGAFYDTAEPSWTIGTNNKSNTGEDQWDICGWSWERDVFCHAHGAKPIGWLPFHTESKAPAGLPPALTAYEAAKGGGVENILDGYAIDRAIFDPGEFVGPRGNRSLSRWQADAVRTVIRSALTSPASGERDAVIEVTDAMIEDGAIAIDAMWSEGQDRGPAFAETEREYQAHCRSTARAAIVAALRMEGK